VRTLGCSHATYGFSGSGAPVTSLPAANIGNAGQTSPVKWQLNDANGEHVSSLSTVKSISYWSAGCSAYSVDSLL
jgi:hypothetical protein